MEEKLSPKVRACINILHEGQVQLAAFLHKQHMDQIYRDLCANNNTPDADDARALIEVARMQECPVVEVAITWNYDFEDSTHAAIVGAAEQYMFYMDHFVELQMV